MKRFAVDLYFRRAPAWGGEYRAHDKAGAIEQAKQWARGCGWTEAVTKAVARELPGGDAA